MDQLRPNSLPKEIWTKLFKIDFSLAYLFLAVREKYSLEIFYIHGKNSVPVEFYHLVIN